MLSERDMTTFGYPGSRQRQTLHTAQREVWSLPSSPSGRNISSPPMESMYHGRMSMAAVDPRSLEMPLQGPSTDAADAASVSSVGGGAAAATFTPPLSPRNNSAYAPRSRAKSADLRDPIGAKQTLSPMRHKQRHRYHHRVQSEVALPGGANFFDLASMGLEELSARPRPQPVHNRPTEGRQAEIFKTRGMEKDAKESKKTKDNENFYTRSLSRKKTHNRSASLSPMRVVSVLGAPAPKPTVTSKAALATETKLPDKNAGVTDNSAQPGFNFDMIWNDELEAVPITQTSAGVSQRPRTNTADSSILKESQRDNVFDAAKATKSSHRTTKSSKRSHKRAVSMPHVKGVSAIFSGGGIVLGGISPSPTVEDASTEEGMSNINKKESERPGATSDGKQVADLLTVSGRDSVLSDTSKTATSFSVRSEDLRTSELEPSEHQVGLPDANDVLMYARIASLSESYRIVDQNFEFGSLVGLSRFYLESALRGTDPTVTLGGGGENVLVSSHKPIIKSFLDCAEDLVVERFFKSGGNSEHERTEVAIFSSQTHRQFIVSYRGTTEQQLKPVSTKHAKQKDEAGAVSILHPEHPVPVNPIIKKAYFSDELENKVFAALNKLTAENPFFDVVTTGHSFGAMLATVAGIRYASQFPIMRVSSIIFGSPRIGGEKFRDLANSLPNLKLMRIEQGDDDWVSMPEGYKWAHGGHSIVIDPAVSTSNSHTAASERTQDTSSNDFAIAYKFDKKRPTGASASYFFGMHKPKKGESNIMSYMHTVEKFTHMGFPWVASFFGENRDGVSGSNMESRHVV